MVVIIVGSSLILLVFLQNFTESTVRNNIYDQQIDRQAEVTNSISQSISSDLGILVSVLDGLANSDLLQRGDFASNETTKLIDDKLQRYGAEVNDIFLLDRNNMVTLAMPGPNTTTDDTNLKAGDDLSQRQWVKDTKTKTGAPYFFGGFERQGVYKIFITFPILDRETNERLGIVGASISTSPFFSAYGNLEDLDEQFLVVYDKGGNIITNPGNAGLLGQNFFGEFVQDFVARNKVLNNLTRNLLQGNSGFGIYDYGRGERITTQEPITVNGRPEFFVQAVTPTSGLYSDLENSLFIERVKLFSLFAATLAGVIVLMIFLIKWNNSLKNEVTRRTKELHDSNKQLTEANNQLERNNKLQKEFINIAAHELRTPIQPILGLSEIVAKENKDKDLDKYLEVIFRNAKRLRKLTENILDVTRIESKMLKLNKEPVRIHDLLLSMVKEYRTEVIKEDHARQVRLLYRPNVDGDPANIVVEADMSRLMQIISNLLNNALRFSRKEGGEIEVTLSEHSEGDNKFAVVNVTDYGEGIDPRIEANLFTMFSTNSYDGTGLGLYLCKNLVEAQGGKIWAKNNPRARGAVFGFYLKIVNGGADFHL
ncbi:MAG TPA: sensor histidine kinase [Nitrososphaeraceae archaeon]|nr:sensor histidine kinase [Nitrososphaeraceae archaeon]